MSRTVVTTIGGALLLVLLALPVCADNWPSRPIRLVVPFSPGGSTDITARVVADGLRPLLGQTVVVDNRAGASGNIAAELVARATPDGYTFLVSSATLATNVSLYRKVSYDFVRDFAPMTQINFSTAVLVVNPSLPAANLAEFIVMVKGGQKVSYGTAGHGSSQHLGAALFNNMVHIPYKGGAPATIALVGGEVQSIFAPLIEVLPHIRSGAIRALGVCGKKSSPLVASVPMISELLPRYEMTSWTGIQAPAQTPA